VINIDNINAFAFAHWLTRTTGQTYMLLSEAEWEYAARAGTDTPWHTGDAILIDDANLLDQFKRTVDVGAYPPNAFGPHDMHGNVWKMTADCYDHTEYASAPANGIRTAPHVGCAALAIRGGGFDT
jgi:formylglycine-generating enzyme required for sulfatase activity